MAQYVDGNQAELFVNGNECLAKLLERLEAAKHHIHIEIMAFNNDKTGKEIANVLMNKAQLDSVEVRLLTNFPATDWSIPMLRGTPNDPTLKQDHDNTLLFKPDLSVPLLFPQMQTAGVQIINSHPLSHYGTDAEIIENEDLDTLVSLLGRGAGAMLIKIKNMILDGYYRRDDFDASQVPIHFQVKQNALDLKHKATLPMHLDHRKIVVIDGTEAFVCTFNIAREYLYEIPFDSNLHENFWLDAMVWLRGPIVNQVQEAFAERWMLSAGDVFTTTFQQASDNPYVPNLQPIGNMKAAIVTSGYEGKIDNPIRDEMMLAMKARKGESMALVNPYICDGYHEGEDEDGLLYYLIEAAEFGSQVVVISADHHLDMRYSRDAGQYRYQRMVASGIEVCEYPGRMLHAKLLTIGTDWATIGSYNWNYRSARRDLECNVFIISSEFVNQIQAELIQLRAAAAGAPRTVTTPPVTTPPEEYIIGCLDNLGYQSLPEDIKKSLNERDTLTILGEDLELI